MSERIMKNFPIEYEGNTYWRSRSVAVVGFTFCKNEEGEWCVLANKRGPGCPDEVGKWCTVCGFLDFGENGKEAVARETREECGVILEPEEFELHDVDFSTRKEQNVNIMYYTFLTGVTSDYPLSNKDNEVNETTDIQWVPLKNLDKYEWAFRHEYFIPEVFIKQYIIKQYKRIYG